MKEQNKPKPNFPNKQPNIYLKYSGMGIKMAAIMGAGTYGGVRMDEWLGLKFPIFTIVLAMASVFLAIYIFIKDFIKK